MSTSFITYFFMSVSIIASIMEFIAGTTESYYSVYMNMTGYGYTTLTQVAQ